MAQSYTSGYGSYANYGFEATYGAGATSARVFGSGLKLTHNRKNNMQRVFGLGARNATTTVATKYEGTATVEFNLTNASIFRAILGAVADTGGGGPAYVHTYTETNVVPSFAIDTGTELGTNDEVTELQGCKVGSMTLTATVGELVRIRLECPYKTETLATSGIGSQSTEAYSTFEFAQGVLQFPSGSTIGAVQSVEITMNNTLEGVWGLGSRLKTAEVEKTREYNIRMTVAFDDTTDFLSKFFGATSGPLATSTPAATATLILTFDTGGTGASSDSIVMTFANISLDEETLPKDVNEVIKEDVSGWALSCTNVVWTNGTSADNATP